MKKVLLVLVVSAVFVLGFSSCGKYCHCTVSKDGKVLEEHQFDVKNTNQCEEQRQKLLDPITNSPAPATGMSVSCDML